MDLGQAPRLASAPDEPPLRSAFADPETERAFLRAERIERGQAIRALIVIAVADPALLHRPQPDAFPAARAWSPTPWRRAP